MTRILSREVFQTCGVRGRAVFDGWEWHPLGWPLSASRYLWNRCYPTLPEPGQGINMISRKMADRLRGPYGVRSKGWVVLLALGWGMLSDTCVWSQEATVQEQSNTGGGTTQETATQETATQETAGSPQDSEPVESQAKADPGNKTPFQYQVADDEKGLRRLMPDHEVWFDVKQKIVVANAEVVLNRGPLEMFACPPNTKEHESILRVKSAAFVIHAGLLAVGAKSGHPVKFDPKYEAATGQEIDIFLVWDHEGKQRWARAQDWVLNSKSRKPMQTPWVFAGSGYWVNPDNGTRHYLAESGELICVSNFSTATLDLPVESSQANEGLLFEANTENIPPKRTAVKMVLVPKTEKEPEANDRDPSSEPDKALDADPKKEDESLAPIQSGDNSKLQ
jgi:hypothetical protein